MEVGDWETDFRPTQYTAVIEVFSKITSPVFSELGILIGIRDVVYLPSETQLFEALHAMDGVRPFKLVFLLLAQDPPQEGARRMLSGVLDSVAAKGLLDFLDSPPTVRSTQINKGWARTVD